MSIPPKITLFFAAKTTCSVFILSVYNDYLNSPVNLKILQAEKMI